MAFGVTIIEEVVVVVVLYPPYSEQGREKSLVVKSCYVPRVPPAVAAPLTVPVHGTAAVALSAQRAASKVAGMIQQGKRGGYANLRAACFQ